MPGWGAPHRAQGPRRRLAGWSSPLTTRLYATASFAATYGYVPKPWPENVVQRCAPPLRLAHQSSHALLPSPGRRGLFLIASQPKSPALILDLTREMNFCCAKPLSWRREMVFVIASSIAVTNTVRRWAARTRQLRALLPVWLVDEGQLCRKRACFTPCHRRSQPVLFFQRL